LADEEEKRRDWAIHVSSIVRGLRMDSRRGEEDGEQLTKRRRNAAWLMKRRRDGTRLSTFLQSSEVSGWIPGEKRRTVSS
jgi:hypothetical protein